jgi:hypothetical protein
MSKQSEAKAAQHYSRVPNNCGSCRHFQFEEVRVKGSFGGGTYVEQKNLRCGVGGFKVHKTACCVRFEHPEAV